MSIDLASSIVPIFDRNRLKLARQSQGLKKSELAKAIGVTPAAVTQFENGDAKPSARVLARAALALGYGVTFFAEEPHRQTPLVGQAFFRSLRSARQIDRDRAEAHAVLLHELVRLMERYVVLPPVDFPDLSVPETASRETIEERAKELRRYWGVPGGPIGNIVRLLESRGAVVTRHLMGRRELDAFSRWFDLRPVVMLGLDKCDLARQRFDAAHELAHIVLHTEAESGSTLVEHQAHAFAASFLMPKDEIINQLPTRLDWKRLFSLKLTWGVSVAALLFRCRELGTMSESTYRRAMTKLSQFGWRTNEPNPLPGDESPMVLQRALELMQQHGVSAAELAENAGFPREMVSEVFASESARPLVTV